jgi:hypothetical protein
MTSLLVPQETLALAKAGAISRLGAFVSTRTLNLAAGIAEGLLVGPSGTAGQECISVTTAALVQASCGWTVWRPMSDDFDATHHYADNEAVAVMESGHMHVLCEGTCVVDKPVYARITSDGGSNLIVGKARADSDGGVTLTTTATVDGQYTVGLSNGVVTEYFQFTASTSTATQIVTGLVAAIDASANFAATGTTTATITAQTGSEVSIVFLQAPTQVANLLYVKTDTQKAVRVPGAFFDQSRSGAGLVEIRQEKLN